MIRHITYASENMSKSGELCILSAEKMGVHDSSCVVGVTEYDTFQWLNKETLKQERGAGYWLWKPWIIAAEMDELKDDDILIYSDAGVEFIAPVREIVNRMDEDIFFFTNGHKHKEWCKADVMKAINGWRCLDNFEQTQVQASVIFFKVNQKTRDFVKEWLLWCQMPGFIDDSPSKEANCKTFAEHRHDQAILTCLQIKYGHKLHWWPTQYSNHIPRSAEDSYPVMFNHHRKRNNEW